MSVRRVLLVSASMGAGHDAAARAISADLAARGATVETVDLLSLPRFRQGDLLRGFYSRLVGQAPAAYDAVMRAWARHPGFFEQVTAAGGGGYERGLLERVRAHRADLVVTTYNLAAQTAGRLRRQRQLDVPVASYVTDPGAHPYWVAAGADLHLAPLAATAAALRGLGADPVAVVSPAVGRPSGEGPLREVARKTWELPENGRIALVNGGSWGVGQGLASAETLAAAGVIPVVLCGRSARLRAQVDAIGSARGIGWTDDVAGLLAAADVVVDNAGGTTCWEALAAGRPVVVHRPIPGHGRINAATLAEAGLVRWTTTDAELVAAAQHASPPTAADDVFAAPSVADRLQEWWP